MKDHRINVARYDVAAGLHGIQSCMSLDELDMRIAVSWRTLVAWTAILPSLHPEGTLEMVGEEVDLLDRWDPRLSRTTCRPP